MCFAHREQCEVCVRSRSRCSHSPRSSSDGPPWGFHGGFCWRPGARLSYSVERLWWVEFAARGIVRGMFWRRRDRSRRIFHRLTSSPISASSRLPWVTVFIILQRCSSFWMSISVTLPTTGRLQPFSGSCGSARTRAWRLPISGAALPLPRRARVPSAESFYVRSSRLLRCVRLAVASPTRRSTPGNSQSSYRR